MTDDERGEKKKRIPSLVLSDLIPFLGLWKVEYLIFFEKHIWRLPFPAFMAGLLTHNMVDKI